jgi:hypothetical protein
MMHGQQNIKPDKVFLFEKPIQQASQGHVCLQCSSVMQVTLAAAKLCDEQVVISRHKSWKQTVDLFFDAYL